MIDSQTFPQYEFIGWFHILPNNPLIQPVKLSQKIHEQVAKVVDNPVLLIVYPNNEALPKGTRLRNNSNSPDIDMIDGDEEENSKAEDVNTELPLNAYEPIYKDMKLEFIPMPPIQIETGEAERIAVDDIVKGSKEDEDYNLSESLTNQQGAIRMLHKRIKFLIEYLVHFQHIKKQQATDPSKQIDASEYAIIRKLNAFAYQLSSDRGRGFDSAIQKQEIDVLMATLLSTVMKGELSKLTANTVWASKRAFATNPVDIGDSSSNSSK